MKTINCGCLHFEPLEFVKHFEFYMTFEKTSDGFFRLLRCEVSGRQFAGLGASVFLLDTWPIMLMAISVNSVPFIFNPLGFYYPRLRQDFNNWNAWIASRVRQ